MKSLSVVFAGTPEFGLPALKALADSHHQLLAVYTQPDRPAGRGRKVQYSPIKDWALMQNTPVYQPLNFKEPTQVDELANLKPDVLVVIAYGLILPRKVLAIPRLGCINVHASLLPRWRGASPIQHAILHGDKESGVTIMQMDAGMDTGDSLLTLACPLSPKETAGSLHDKLAQLAVEPLLQVLDLLASERSQPVAQNNELATYAPKIQKEQARIDWSQPAMIIDRQIRAYNPWPICFSHFAGGESFRIHQAEIFSQTLEVNEPGKILQINKAGMLIAAGEQAINIKQLQFAGGKIISVADWINSGQHSVYIGQVLQ